MVNEAVRDIEMSRGRSERELSPRSVARSELRTQNTLMHSQSAFTVNEVVRAKQLARGRSERELSPRSVARSE